MVVPKEVLRMPEEQVEALKTIVKECPMYTSTAMQIIKDGEDLVEFLELLRGY